MQHRFRLVASAIALAVASGCAPVAVSHYQSARPIGAGNVQFGAGITVPHEARYGLGRNNADGDGTGDHFNVLQPDVELHYGVTQNAEIEGRAWIGGLEAGGRYSITNSPQLHAAIGVYGMYFSGGFKADVTTSSGTVKDQIDIRGYALDVPMTVSLHFSPRFAIYGGPVATLFSANAKYTEPDGSGGQITLNRSLHTLLPGAFVGVNIGRVVQLSPGVTFYVESNKYPIPAMGGGSVFAYPWIGLTYTTGQMRAQSYEGE